MAESAVATKTSSDKAPAAPQPAAPEKVRAGGPTMQGMSPQEMQQRFGNAGTAQAIAEQEVVLSPFEAIAPAREGVADRARTSKRHPEASVPVDAAQDAAIEAPVEQKRGAASKTVTEIDKVETKEIKRSAGDGFEAELRAALLAAVPIPENEDEAKATIEKGGSDASATLRGGVDSEGNKTGPLADATAEAAPLEEATSVEAEAKPEDQDAPEEVELATENVGDAPAPVASDSVVPPPISDSKLDYSDHSASTDQVMAENEITDEQLAKGNEPEFNETLGTKEEAANRAQSGAEAFRESEAGTRESAGSKASKTMAGGLTGFHSSRTNEIGDVVDTQDSTKSEDERERRRITNKIVKVKDDTQEDVEKILDKMEDQASTRFEIGLADAEKAYEKSFDDNLGGVNFFGAFRIGEDTDRAFRKGREAYEAKVDTAITAVVRIVNAALKRAERRVAKGKKEVDDFVEGLDESVKQFGVEAQDSVAADFDEMESSIESRKSGLIETLVAQYQASQERVAAMEERLRLENMSIWDRIYEQTVGLAKKILEFKDLLLSILGEAGEVVKAIIADPIAFLKNLIAGIVGGLNLFKDNIVEHLKGGLMGWLVGSLQSAGLELPTSFDLKGIFQLIFGILGVTYGIIREKAVKLLGEKVVGRLEQTAEIFIVLATEGPAGVWQMFVEQMGDVKEMIMGEIRGFVIEKIIIAGITWLISLMNPASAFFKAVKAIYDIVMFFIERGQQIMALVNTIIGAIGEIVAGNVEGMSKAVENVLARLLPVAISFLASLLGLGGITDKIREIVEKIRDKVDAVVDWIIAKAVKLAQKIGDLLPGGKERKAKREAEAAKDEEPDYDDPEKEAKVAAALAAIDEEVERLGPVIGFKEAQQIKDRVKAEHSVLTDLVLSLENGTWVFRYVASPGKDKSVRSGLWTIEVYANRAELNIEEVEEYLGARIESRDGGQWFYNPESLDFVHERGTIPAQMFESEFVIGETVSEEGPNGEHEIQVSPQATGVFDDPDYQNAENKAVRAEALKRKMENKQGFDKGDERYVAVSNIHNNANEEMSEVASRRAMEHLDPEAEWKDPTTPGKGKQKEFDASYEMGDGTSASVENKANNAARGSAKVDEDDVEQTHPRYNRRTAEILGEKAEEETNDARAEEMQDTSEKMIEDMDDNKFSSYVASTKTGTNKGERGPGGERPAGAGVVTIKKSRQDI